LTTLVAAVRERCADISAAWPKAARGDTRAIHRARTASRRLRELLPIAAAAAPKGGAGRLRREARRLTRALGPVRELDVAIAVLADETRGEAVTRSEIAAVDRALEAERIRARDALRTRLDAIDIETWRGRCDELVDALANLPGRSWEPALAKRLRRRALRVLEAQDAAGTLYAPEPLHRVRIAAKKLRYALEIARDLTGVSADGLIASVKGVQDRLGRIHDLNVLDQRVRSIAWPGGRRAASGRLALLSELERECREQHAAYLARRDLLRNVARETAHATSAGVMGRRRPLRMKLAARTPRMTGRSGRAKSAAGSK